MTKPEPPRKPPYYPNATVRAQIAAGPKFEDAPDIGLCVACGYEADIDATTGLCRHCWRTWRWSPVAERRNPCAATTETP